MIGLDVAAPNSPLPVGEIVQLTALARFADGSTRDVTGEEALVLTTSEQNVAVIEPGARLLTMHPGDVVVGISYQSGASIALTEVTIRVRNADDADGLSNLQERAAGTDPRRADTDGDFQPDGLEVALGTDPLHSDLTVSGESPLLNDRCTVSALNRSARVRSNGVWVLPNVPANAGRIRVRANCVEADGVTRAGQSDFFTVPPRGVVEVPDITFEDPTAIPAVLRLSAAVTTLTTAGYHRRLVP